MTEEQQSQSENEEAAEVQPDKETAQPTATYDPLDNGVNAVDSYIDQIEQPLQ